ncbi:MAG TPA: aspartate ammonia-lyase, partial [Spirochaetota bacterium]|nr:aspartate ammonia-lyase [Spirochaetota bacterium]
MRTVHDTLGSMEVPDDAFYGAQTARAIVNFPVSGRPLPPVLIRALVGIKRAWAL